MSMTGAAMPALVQRSLPCTLMRGGTSRGPFFLADDLPRDPDERDAVLLSALGSGHDLQVDGLGGGNPLTSKVAIISRSSRPDADIDYLFAQVNVARREVDTSPNCGNMLSGAGPFAIEKGLVAARDGRTSVRIYNVNTRAFIDATVVTPGGRVTYEGDCRIDGVPDPAAPVELTFLDAAGSKTGRLLPTGSPRDAIDGLEVSCVDAATPLVILRAADLGLRGSESPAEIDADIRLMQRINGIRIRAGAMMGLGDVTSLIIPKPVIIGEPRRGGTLAARYFTPHTTHRAFAVTGAVGLATACATPGTLAHTLCGASATDPRVTIEHPAGVIQLTLVPPISGGAPRVALLRTARKILEGTLFVRVPARAREPANTTLTA
jgi:2-methylaconitate cis-trans-isomerase PrpF